MEIQYKQMEWAHMIVISTININSTIFQTIALFDMGTTVYEFMDENLTYHHIILLQFLKKPWTLELIGGRLIAFGEIFHILCLKMNIDNDNHVCYLIRLLPKSTCNALDAETQFSNLIFIKYNYFSVKRSTENHSTGNLRPNRYCQQMSFGDWSHCFHNDSPEKRYALIFYIFI